MSSWMDEDKSNWRRLFPVLLFIAMLAPWYFARISIPGANSCAGVWLDENFCGRPTTGLPIFLFMFGGLFNVGKGLFTQSMDFSAWSRLFFTSLLLLILLLPFLTTIFVIVRVNHRRWHLLHIVVLALAAAGAGLFMSLPGLSQLHWMLWGPLLYICLAIGMLLWEALAFYDEREPGL